MEPKKTPPLLGVALTNLRRACGYTQAELAAAARIPSRTVSDYETGKQTLTRPLLDELARVMGARPLRVERAILSAMLVCFDDEPEPATHVDPTEDQSYILEKATALWVRDVGGRLLKHQVARARARNARTALEHATTLWQQLSPLSEGARRSRVAAETQYQTWAFCLWLSDESERKAAHHAGEARDLAELARLVARHLRHAKPEDRFFTRLAGRAEAALANALRVQGDHDAAESSFARAEELWKAGDDEAGLLSEAHLYHLEASLRRAQRRFEEALRLHALALESARVEEHGTILLNLSATREQMCDYEGSLAALEQAAPLIDGQSQPRLQCVLRFNQAANLCRLGRAEEAEPIVAEVRLLSQQLDNGLDLVRTLALEALVDAGRGRTEAAIAKLEQVCRELQARGHAFDFALVALDLALLHRGQGRWPEIRDLATKMVGIFRAKKVRRETLAAIVLFQEAAQREAVPVDLVRRLQDFLKQARTRPGLRFER
jgi:transcriptional regulator with XRE-family HTH domain